MGSDLCLDLTQMESRYVVVYCLYMVCVTYIHVISLFAHFFRSRPTTPPPLPKKILQAVTYFKTSINQIIVACMRNCKSSIKQHFEFKHDGTLKRRFQSPVSTYIKGPLGIRHFQCCQF